MRDSFATAEVGWTPKLSEDPLVSALRDLHTSNTLLLAALETALQRVLFLEKQREELQQQLSKEGAIQ